jgi:hypothetical protein
MFNLALVAVASGLLAGPLIAEKQRNTGPILIFKTPLPILFVAAALMQPHPMHPHSHFNLHQHSCRALSVNPVCHLQAIYLYPLFILPFPLHLLLVLFALDSIHFFFAP